MSDDLKIAINLMQDKIRDCEYILLIFDNQAILNIYKRHHIEKSNEILITVDDLVNKGLVGRRFKRYWFMTDRDI